MNKRIEIIGGAAVLFAVVLGAWWFPTAGPERPDAGITVNAGITADEDALPVPPVPPRIAAGPDYEYCLEMIDADPAGANRFAETWEAIHSGEGAAHCRALALIALGEPEAGARMLDQLGERSQASALTRASVYGQAAQAWRMADEPDRALAAATAALALNPDDPDRLIDRSIAAATLERYQEAIDDLDRAIQIDPKRFDALVLRAAAWRLHARLDRAKDDVERALSINPDYPEALLERGILRQRTGDAAGARADWEQAIALAPDSTAADLAQQNLALLEAGPEKN